MVRPSATRQLEELRDPREVKLTEDIARFLEYAWPTELPWTHFPAGEARDRVTRERQDGSEYTYSPAGARLKRMGLKPGWFDFQLILPNAQFATAEVKTRTGQLTEEQKQHWRKLTALKAARAIWRSVDDAERDCARWLSAFQGWGLRARTITQTRGPLL